MTGRSRLPRSAALLAAVGIAAGVAALPSRAEAVYIRDDVPVALYNALAEQSQYAAAGYFGIAGTGDRCSGVLVAPDAFLTAAHCTTDAPPSGFTVGFGLDLPATFGPSNVASILVNPAWVPASEDKPLSGKDQLANQLYDIALVKLAAPVAGIAPAQIWLGDPAGLVGTLTGYGYQDTGLNTGADAHGGEPGYYLGGAHSRLAAQNVIDTAGPDTPITAVFDSPHAGPGGDRGAPLPLEGSGCTGDSGSPLYVAIGGQNLIVGTVHGPPPGPGGGPPAVAGCGYGVVEAWAPLADPVNVAFLAGADSAIAFVAPEPVPEPASASVLGAALLGLVATAVLWRRRGRDARPTRSTAAGGSARGRAGRDLVR